VGPEKPGIEPDLPKDPSPVTKTRLIRPLAAAAIAVGGLALTIAPSTAHNPPGTVNDPHLEPFTSPAANGNPTALIEYEKVAGGDAPGSPAPNALRIETNANAAEPYSYAGAAIRKAPMTGKALGDVRQISFKTKGYSGAGAPRLSMTLSNGTVAYLSSYHCSTDLAPTAWHKATFTASFAADPSCTIYTSTAPGNSGYTSDATSSAWKKLVAAEGPGVEIRRLELVQDEGPGVTWVDDIRLDSLIFAGPTMWNHNH
jgi:hypothetical protein